MRFDLRTPCRDCPFRTDIEFALAPGRVREIWDAITTQDATFVCHKTTRFDDDGEYRASATEQHCAGALILLLRKERPNQLMRIAARIGRFDPDALDLDAPVFDDVDAMILARESAYGATRHAR